MRRTRQLQIPRCIVNTVSQRKKKNYCPRMRFMPVPITLASRRPIFFLSFVETIRIGRAFFARAITFAARIRRYTRIYMRQQMPGR